MKINQSKERNYVQNIQIEVPRFKMIKKVLCQNISGIKVCLPLTSAAAEYSTFTQEKSWMPQQMRNTVTVLRDRVQAFCSLCHIRTPYNRMNQYLRAYLHCEINLCSHLQYIISNSWNKINWIQCRALSLPLCKSDSFPEHTNIEGRHLFKPLK